MRTIKLAWMAVAAAAVAGCASTQGLHTRGQPRNPASLHASHSLAGAPLSSAAWPAKDWWQQLGDAQLNGLIHEALKNSPDLAAASARAREAQAQAQTADAQLQPTLDVGGSVSGARLPTTVVPAPLGGHFQWAKYVYTSFKWNLDIWGGTRAAWEAAVDRSRAAAVDRRAARLQLSVNVARAYVRLNYAFQAHDIAKDELKRAQSIFKLTAQRVHAGIDSKLQLARARSEVAMVKGQLASTAQQIHAARVALSVLLGKGPDRGLKIQRPHGLKAARLAIPSRLPAVLVGRRPDLVAARWRVEAAQKQARTARTRFLPNLNISALAGLVATGGTNLFQLPARFYNVAPAFSLPIFEGGRLRANLKSRNAQYDLAVAQYNKTLIGAVNAVADDLSNARALQQQIQDQQQALAAAHHAWKLAEQTYKAGIGSYLQALSVRQQLLQARQRLAVLKTQKIDLSVRLIQTLGGGFEVHGAVAASHAGAEDGGDRAHSGTDQAEGGSDRVAPGVPHAGGGGQGGTMTTTKTAAGDRAQGDTTTTTKTTVTTTTTTTTHASHRDSSHD